MCAFDRHPVFTPGRSGLTLLELLVVLTILAVLATVAVNTLGPRVESERLQATVRQMDHIREAIVGKPGATQADGTPILSGFVVDVGRRPVWKASAEPVAYVPGGASEPTGTTDSLTGRELRELWDEREALAQSFPFQFRAGPSQPVDFSDVRLPCGWRGPYLLPPIGADRVVDAWGRPFEAMTTPDGEVLELRSRPPGMPGEPLSVRFDNCHVTVSGVLQYESGPNQVAPVVHMLIPDPSKSVRELVVLEDEDDTPETFTFSNVPVGVRAVCVSLDGRRVVAQYIQVPHQGLSLVLDLPGLDGGSNE